MFFFTFLQLVWLVPSAAKKADLMSFALGTARWLEESATCTHTDHGRRRCHWPLNSTDSAPALHPQLTDSLYYGSPGIALFFRQLANAVGDDTKEADHWEAAAETAVEDMRHAVAGAQAAYGANVGLYYGLAGIAYGLRATNHNRSQSHAETMRSAAELEAHILTKVAPFSSSSKAILWNNTDVAHGVAGASLYLLWVARRIPDTAESRALLDATRRAGQWLLARAEVAPKSLGGGLRWWRGPDTDGDHDGQFFPTFCCGTAGVGYFLATLSSVVNNADNLWRELLPAAIAAGEHILGLAVRSNGTLLLPHGEQGADLSQYYLGWCGGAPGWARLFVRLWELTQEVRWLRALEEATLGVMAFVLPNLAMLLPTGPHGPWRNLGQCCGVAGAGSFLLGVATSQLPLSVALKASAMAGAEKLADAIVVHAVTVGDDGITFPSAEEHGAPTDARWQAGWMQGAAGIASFLLHVRAVAVGSCAGAREPWPDEPWQCSSNGSSSRDEVFHRAVTVPQFV